MYLSLLTSFDHIVGGFVAGISMLNTSCRPWGSRL